METKKVVKIKEFNITSISVSTLSSSSAASDVYKRQVFAMSSDEPDIVELIFTPDFNPHGERAEGLYGILCVVDTETKKVVKIKEFNITSINVSTSSQIYGRQSYDCI